jgi:hypothetical protein
MRGWDATERKFASGGGGLGFDVAVWCLSMAGKCVGIDGRAGRNERGAGRAEASMAGISPLMQRQGRGSHTRRFR